MPTVRPIKFCVYAGARDGSGLYVQARIFSSRRAMLAALRAEGGHFSRGTDGVFLGSTRIHYSADGRSRTSPCLGTVNLYRARLGVEVITHEFTHAMFAWAWRKGLIAGLSAMPVEEKCAYALGRMVRRFVVRANKLGLYEE